MPKTVGAFLRYYVGISIGKGGAYVDIDKAIAYILVGILIMAVSYYYNKFKQIEKENKADREDIFKATAWIEDFSKFGKEYIQGYNDFFERRENE